MKSRLKKYLLYISIAIVGGVLLYILVETVKAKNTGFEAKTLWDWMELFIIPLFLAGGAFYLNRSERESDRQRAEERAKLEREIATDRQQEAALQSYLDRMSDLLLKEKLREPDNDEVRNFARIRTLTVLRGLDGKRKGIILLFLSEAGLIAEEPIIKLNDADLSGVDLRYAFLRRVNLSEANLQNANLSKALLQNANLNHANLQNANLSAADMKNVKLLFADLQNANLKDANLQNADLSYAKLDDADLSSADLSDAKLSFLSSILPSEVAIANKKLATTPKSLKGAIMPDGSKHG